MPTYEDNVDESLPAHVKAPKEPNMRRLMRSPGHWEWIKVPDDEYREIATADAPTAVSRKPREHSAPEREAFPAFIGDSDMAVRKESLFKAFEAREGTIREKVIRVLVDNLNQPVATKVLLKSAYGKQDEENIGALRNVLKGVQVMIDDKKLDVALEHISTDDVPSGYRLHAV